jgi:hypothetical protein
MALSAFSQPLPTTDARQPGLTESEIAESLFANEGDSQRVNLMCRRLIAEGRLRRCGTGTAANPFTYSPKRGCAAARRAITTVFSAADR